MSVGIIRNLGSGEVKPKAFNIYEYGVFADGINFTTLLSSAASSTTETYRYVTKNAQNYLYHSYKRGASYEEMVALTYSSRIDLSKHKTLKAEITASANTSGKGIVMAYSTIVPTVNNTDAIGNATILSVSNATSGVITLSADISQIDSQAFIILGAKTQGGNTQFNLTRLWLE